MAKKSLWRLIALLAAFSLVAAACGDADDADTGGDADATTTTAAETDDTEAPEPDGDDDAEATGAGDGVLTIGTLLPITGDLAFLGPPEVAGARLAVQDINEAGGVLGNDVVLVEGDSGDTNTDIANPTVDRLLSEGVDAIVGAASSAVSKLVIDKITGAGVIQFSPANTSPDFTNYPDDGLYFRTAPSDLLQGRVLANLVAEDGHATAAVLFRQESYGEGLANSFKDNFGGLGGELAAFLPYAVDTENFDAEVGQIVDAAPDAIIVIGFNESAAILTTMHERGIGPQDTAVYGVDGNIGGIGAEMSDPTILTGMQGTEPSVDLSSIADFTSRLDGAYEGGVGGVFAYGAETYDAIVIIALAAVAAGTDEPRAVADEIIGVTKDGTDCFSFAECSELLEAGEDINYIGVGGSYEFTDAGEPAAASFRIATYSGDTTPDPALDRYVFAS
jgi:ABC-type branched-subunit amino acid transport system substrate-binding protein